MEKAFIETMTSVQGLINGYYTGSSNETSESIDLTSGLIELISLVERNDLDAADLLKNLTPELSKHMDKSELSKLQRSMEQYEWDNVRNILLKLQK